MNQWWYLLLPVAKFYWTIALFASVLQLCLMFGAVMGAEHNIHGGDGADGDHGHAPKFFSLRALVAFFVGFGWAGVLAVNSGFSTGSVHVAALVTGGIFMVVIAGLMSFLVSLRSEGTLDYKNAIGVRGKVYVTIPPHRTGQGQVEIMLQSRLITASAITDAATALAPLTAIDVIAVEADNLLIVKPVITFLPL